MSREEYLSQLEALQIGGDWRAAFALAEQRFERNKTPGPLVSMCESLLAGRDFSRLGRHLLALETFDADPAETVRLRALQAEAMARQSSAISIWMRYCEMKPGKLAPLLRVAELCLMDGRLIRLQGLLACIKRKWPDRTELAKLKRQLDHRRAAEDHRDVKARAQNLFAQGLWDEARVAWELSFTQAPDDDHALMRVCECLLEQGEFVECAAILTSHGDKLAKSSRAQETSRRLLIGLAKSGGRLKLAGKAALRAASASTLVSTLRFALGRRPETADLQMICGELERRGDLKPIRDAVSELLAFGEIALARRLTNFARALAPRDCLLTFLVLRVALAQGRRDEVRSLLARLQASPAKILATIDTLSAYAVAHHAILGDDPVLRALIGPAWRGLLATRAAKFELAETLYVSEHNDLLAVILGSRHGLDAQGSDELDFLQIVFLADADRAQDVVRRAGAWFAAQADALGTEDRGLFSRLSEVLFERERIELLEVALSVETAAYATDARLKRVRAQLATREARWSEAAKLWADLYAGNPNDVWAQINHTNALSRLGDLAEARRSFERLTSSKDVNDGPFRSELAICAARMGDLATARQIAVDVLNSADHSELRLHQRASIARVLSMVGLPELAWPLYEKKCGVEAGASDRLAVILDPGLTVSPGHHVNYNLFAWRLLQTLGAQDARLTPLLLSRVAGDGAPELEDVRIVPALNFEPYAFDDFPIAHECLTALNACFYHDLSRLNLKGRIGMVMMHSMRANMVDGFSQWADEVFYESKGFVVVGLIEVDHIIRDGDISDSYADVYRKALVRLVNNSNIELLVYVETDSGKQFLDDLKIEGLEVKVFPYPAASLCMEYRVDLALEDENHLCLGMVGGTKDIRGSHLLPKAVVDTRDLAENARWKLQIDDQKLRALTPADKLHYLSEMRRCEHVEIIDGVLSVHDYFTTLAALDVVVLPYQERYMVSGSGVFYEALYMEKFLVVPRNTFMPTVLSALNHPHYVMEEASDACLETAIRWVVAHRGEIRGQMSELRAKRPQPLPADEFHELVKSGVGAFS